jgi:hypothetical protein
MELKRAWIIPVVCGLIGAIVMLLVSTQVARQYTQRVDLTASSDDQIASTLGVPGLVPAWQPRAIAEDFTSRLNAEDPDGRCDCRIVGSDTTGALTVYATGSSANEAAARAGEIADRIADERRAKFDERAAAVRDTLVADLERLDAQLDATPPTEPDHLFLLIEQTESARQVAAIDRLSAGGTRGVNDPVEIGEPDVEPRAASTTYVVLGALLGAAVGVAFVVVRRATSRRVLSAVDLSRSATDLPSPHRVRDGEHLDRGVAAALAGAVLADGAEDARGVLVVSPQGDSSVGLVAADIADALSAFGEPVELVPVTGTVTNNSFTVAHEDGPLTDSETAVVTAKRYGQVVLVGRERSSTIEDFDTAVSIISQVGGEVVGVVLVV